MREILIATNNQGKVRELSDMMGELPIRLRTLSEFPEIPEVEETGTTFEANARLKAKEYALASGKYALADDSGLEVTALGGRPGVLSARYGGEDTTFAQKMALLLGEMENSGDTSRNARFVCSIAFASPTGEILFTAEGVCEGTIADSPHGDGGFGYDPLFIPDGYDLTFGQLTAEIKRSMSHRARAFQQIIPFLRHFEAL